MQDIQDTHPLREMVKLEHVLPFLGRFQKKKSNFNLNLKSALLKEMGFKVPKGDAELENDPYMLLGYGVNAYFDVLYALSMMFVTISLMAIPIFFVYGSHTGFAD